MAALFLLLAVAVVAGTGGERKWPVAFFLWKLPAEGVPLEALKRRSWSSGNNFGPIPAVVVLYMEATSGKGSAGSNRFSGRLPARRSRAWPAMVLDGRVILRWVLSKNDGAVPLTL